MKSQKNWRYLSCHAVAILADEKPVNVSDSVDKFTMVNRGGLSSPALMENIVVELTLDSVEQLAGAEKVEIRICNDEFLAPPSLLCDFRDFSRRLKEIAAKREASKLPPTSPPSTPAPPPGRY